MEEEEEDMSPNWLLVSTHGSVLSYVAVNRDATIKEIAEGLCLSERRVAQVVKDLSESKLLCIERRGRRNRYLVDLEANIPQPSFSKVKLVDFLNTLLSSSHLGSHAATKHRRQYVRTSISADRPEAL
jgi:hypothetical protein